VDTLISARDEARARAAKLPENDPARKKAAEFANLLEAIRSDLVATKEGGGITGEEKVREKMGDLYGAINSYDGRPTKSQLDRTNAVAKEFQEADSKFQNAVATALPALNADLQKKSLEPITIMSRDDWEKAHSKD
ncbi:MAG: sialidase, partial [Blastocatellia bacterium]